MLSAAALRLRRGAALGTLAAMPRKATTEDDYRRRILAVERYLEARLDEPLDPQRLATEAAFSLHHFHRIFRAQRGESVMQLVRRLRLERAARRLRGTDVPVTTLAFEAGYESHEAFTRAFADRFGAPPSTFRAEPSIRVREHLRAAPEQATIPVEIRHVAPIRVAYLRHRGAYAQVHEVWARLRAFVERRNLADRLYGVCPDDPEITDEHKLRFDACVEVDDRFVPDGDVALATIAGGTYAVGVHRGPFHALSETYLEVIGRWLPTSGREPSPDAVVEHYLDDPRLTAPGDLRTEVRVRLEE